MFATISTELSDDRRPPPSIVAGVVLVVGVLIGLTEWGLATSNNPHQLLLLDVAVGIVGCGLVPELLRRPVTAAVVLAVLAALSPAATPPATIGTMLVAQRRPLRTAMTVAGIGVLAHAVQGLWRPMSGVSYAWWLALDVAAHAALVAVGALIRAHAELLSSLRERAWRAETEQGRRVAEARALERSKIAREMHDVLAHRLSLLATYAGALEFRPDAPPEQLAQAAGVVRSGAGVALQELRDVISVLRHGDLEDGDLEDGDLVDGDRDRPQPTLADIAGLVAESTAAGMTVQFDNELPSDVSAPNALGRTVYRVVQEALTNVRKHAAGQQVSLQISGRPGGRLSIDIRNRLPDDRSQPTAVGGGMGLVGLTERVQLAGGVLDHQLRDGEFELHAWLPWPS
ncbi:MAG: sensor histidine kinase [Nakamurella sp.]